MKYIATIISLVLIVIFGWIIFKPHNTVPEPIIESKITTPETAPVQSTTTPKISSPVKETPKAPVVTTPNPQPTPIPQTPIPQTPTDTTKYYTATEVSAHASTQSCWSIVNGKVYDLTSWISQHPGGSSAIKRMCGGDGSEDFNNEHGGKSRPERELASFYIGVLK